MIEDLAARQRSEAAAAIQRRAKRQGDAAFWDGQGATDSGGNSIPVTTGSNGPLRLGQSAPLLRGGGSAQIDTFSAMRSVEPLIPVISGRVMVLAYTEKNGIYEVWIGGDRKTPFKIAEVPIQPIPTNPSESLRGKLELIGGGKSDWIVSLQHGSTLRTIHGSGIGDWQLTDPACPYVRYQGNGFWAGGPYHYRPYIHAQKSLLNVTPIFSGFRIDLRYQGLNQLLNDPNFPRIYTGENTVDTFTEINNPNSTPIPIIEAQINAEIAAEEPKFFRPDQARTARIFSTQCWFFSIFKQPNIDPAIEAIEGTNEFTGDDLNVQGSLSINLKIAPDQIKPYGFSFFQNSDSFWEYNIPLENMSGVGAISYTKISYLGSAYYIDFFSPSIGTPGGYPTPNSQTTVRQFLIYNGQEIEVLNGFLGETGYTQWKVDPQEAYPVGHYAYPLRTFDALLEGSTQFVLNKYVATLVSGRLFYQSQSLPPEKVLPMKIGDNLIGLDCRFRG